MEFFKINGKVIRAPTELAMSFETLDKAERTVDGTMVVDIIGTKRRVDVSWDYLSKEDMTTLSNSVCRGNFTEINYPDDETGEFVTMVVRVEGLTYQLHYDWAKSRIMWKSVSVTLTER